MRTFRRKRAVRQPRLSDPTPRAVWSRAAFLLGMALLLGAAVWSDGVENRLLRTHGVVTTATVLSVHRTTGTRSVHHNSVRVRLEVRPGRAVTLDVGRFGWRALVPGQVVLVRYAPDADADTYVVRDAAVGPNPWMPLVGVAAIGFLVVAVLGLFRQPGRRRRHLARARVPWARGPPGSGPPAG